MSHMRSHKMCTCLCTSSMTRHQCITFLDNANLEAIAQTSVKHTHIEGGEIAAIYVTTSHVHWRQTGHLMHYRCNIWWLGSSAILQHLPMLTHWTWKVLHAGTARPILALSYYKWQWVETLLRSKWWRLCEILFIDNFNLCDPNWILMCNVQLHSCLTSTKTTKMRTAFCTSPTAVRTPLAASAPCSLWCRLLANTCCTVRLYE